MIGWRGGAHHEVVGAHQKHRHRRREAVQNLVVSVSLSRGYPPVENARTVRTWDAPSDSHAGSSLLLFLLTQEFKTSPLCTQTTRDSSVLQTVLSVSDLSDLSAYPRIRPRLLRLDDPQQAERRLPRVPERTHGRKRAQAAPLRAEAEPRHRRRTCRLDRTGE